MQYRLQDVINYPNLYWSLQQCKKSKMWKDSVVSFNAYSDFYLFDILYMFYDYTPFYLDPFFHTIVNERGKERLVCSLTIRDRVIQKTINQFFLLPAFAPTLIYDNVASLQGKGTGMAINRMKCHLQKAYRHYGTNFYILKTDIKSYFDTINHDYCKYLISHKTNDPVLLHFFDTLFKMYKYDTFIHGGEYVNAGIGLGGEVPQTFGIIYLNELDHLYKEYYKIPYMIRYMDDTILIHPDKDYLYFVLSESEKYVNNLGLKYSINKTKITHISEGIKFLKFHYYLTDSGKVYIKPEKKNLKREIRKLKSFNDLLESGKITFSDIRYSYTSWRGHIGQADAFEEINQMDQLFNTLFIDNWYLDPEY